METKVNCENPRLIVNQSLNYDFSRLSRAVVTLVFGDGDEDFEEREINCGEIAAIAFYKYVRSVLRRFEKLESEGKVSANARAEFLRRNYCYSAETGESTNLFMEVPCGHCTICNARKASALQRRCALESENWSCKPLFITLTYNDENLPYTGVQKVDCQRFLKRLRINLKRSNLPSDLRYLFVSEYGVLRHRPHYHALIWCNWRGHFPEFLSVVEKSWHLGFVDVQVPKGSVVKYVTKYVTKECEIPNYITSWAIYENLDFADFVNLKSAYSKPVFAKCNPTFRLQSNKGGALGTPFVVERLKDITVERRFLKTGTFSFRSVQNGAWTDLILPKGIIDYIYPSFSRFVPTSVKISILYFDSIIDKLQLHNDVLYQRLMSFFGDQYRRMVSVNAANIRHWRKIPLLLGEKDISEIRSFISEFLNVSVFNINDFNFKMLKKQKVYSRYANIYVDTTQKAWSLRVYPPYERDNQ